VTLWLRNSVVTRSTAQGGVIRTDVCSALPHVLHGQAKILDPAAGWARFEARFGNGQVQGTAGKSGKK